MASFSRRRYLLLPLFFLVLTSTAFPNFQDQKLTELRDQFARRYFQPDAHFDLAKYYLDQGNNVQAFFIIEYARQYRFEEKDFDSAYFAYFGDPMPEPPNNAKLAFESASKLVTDGKYDEAERYFLKANELDNRSFFINAWIGRFYNKTKFDSFHALPFYYKSYFLYPHAYETEFVESRIKNILVSTAGQDFERLRNNNISIAELAKHANPLVVQAALEFMDKNWKPEFLSLLANVMNNDDSVVRWNAFAILHKNLDKSFQRFVDAMVADKDLRKRGLAAYGLIERPGNEKFRILRKMLSDPAELIRFDAISALALKGGEVGKRILKEHERIEKQPRLKALLSSQLK